MSHTPITKGRWKNLGLAMGPCPERARKGHFDPLIPAKFVDVCNVCNDKCEIPIFDQRLMWMKCPGYFNQLTGTQVKHYDHKGKTYFKKPMLPCPACSGTDRVPTEYSLETLLAASPYVIRRAILSALKDESFHDNALPVDYMDVAITTAEKEVQCDH